MMATNDQTPDELMEDAKRKAAKFPGQLAKINLSDRETFSVVYNKQEDTFDCSRKMNLLV